MRVVIALIAVLAITHWAGDRLGTRADRPMH
jgi:hypothetical protein